MPVRFLAWQHAPDPPAAAALEMNVNPQNTPAAVAFDGAAMALIAYSSRCIRGEMAVQGISNRSATARR